MPVSKNRRKGQPRPRKIKTTTFDVQLARLQLAIERFIQESESEVYEELRLNEQLFEKYADEGNAREAVLRFLYVKRFKVQPLTH